MAKIFGRPLGPTPPAGSRKAAARSLRPVLLVLLLSALPWPHASAEEEIEAQGRRVAEAAPSGGTTLHRRQLAMGTWLEVAVTAGDRGRALAASEAVLNAVARAELRLSTWRDDSELATVHRLGARGPVEVSPALARDLSDAMAWHRRTAGAFDPGIGTLVAAWNLRGAGRIPTDDELRAARHASRAHHGLVADGTVHLDPPELRFEEGGFGKGAALRDALRAARSHGATCVVLDFGGQAVVGGECGSVAFGLAHPEDRDAEVAALTVASGSIATSGNSERGFVVDGVRYGHILDPRTGRPAPIWGAVTVVADDPFAADCASTALYVMGPDAGARWAAKQPDIEALFVEESNGAIRFKATEGLRSRLSLPPNHEVEWIPAIEVRQNSPPEQISQTR